jgi:tetrahydromethanopterin S-methyltransferase subunit F
MLGRKRKGVEALSRRQVDEKRQGSDRYCGSPKRLVSFEQFGVVNLLVGGAAWRVLLIGRQAMICGACCTAVDGFSAGMVRAGVLLCIGTQALR